MTTFGVCVITVIIDVISIITHVITVVIRFITIPARVNAAVIRAIAVIIHVIEFHYSLFSSAVQLNEWLCISFLDCLVILRGFLH